MYRIKGLSYREIGELMGVSKQAIHQAIKKFEKILLPKEQLDVYRDKKTEILDSVEFELMNEMLDSEKRKKASLNNVAYSLGTLHGINRLEKGQSTSNISFQDMSNTLAEIQAERKQLEEALGDL